MTWVNPLPAELAADWIASRRNDVDEGPGHLAQFLLCDFPNTEPALTWDTIRLIVQSYPEADFYSGTETEARRVCGVLAAGPVEDLLSYHPDEYIALFEDEARLDRRMAWLLRGVWRSSMSEAIWARVQRAAYESW